MFEGGGQGPLLTFTQIKTKTIMDKQELLKAVIEIGNANGYITYDDIMDVCDGDRELHNFINDELDKMGNDLNFELDL